MNVFLIGIFFAAFFACVRRRIEYGVLAIIFALPLYTIRFHVLGLPSTLLEGMVLVVFCVWLFHRRHEVWSWRKKRISSVYKIFIGIVVLFFLASCVSIFVAPDIFVAAGLWRAYVLEPILFFLVFRDTIRTKKQMERACVVSILSAGSIALYGIFQRITGFGIMEPWTMERRVTSIYPYPNAIGLYLAPIVMFIVALFVWQTSLLTGKIKMYGMLAGSGGMIVLLIAAIFFAKTEAALVALVVSSVTFGFFWNTKFRRTTIVFCTFAVFAVSISPPLRHTFQEKLFLNDWSGTVRKLVWQESIPMIRDHWIWGAGFSGYPERMREYHKATSIEVFQYPHTVVLNVWSEMGIVGLIAFELLVGWFFYILIKSLHILRNAPHGDEKNFLRALAFGCFFAMMTIVIHGLVDVPYFKNDLAIFFWMLIGLAMAVYARVRKIHQARA